MTLAPVRQLVTDGLDLDRVTILVGENGTGKSTIVEAIAMAYGLSPEGGSTGAMHSTRATESELWESLLLERSAGLRKWGYFLRAETMHGLYSYLEDHPGKEPDPDFHRLSHGESFMAMLGTRRFLRGGFFVLDERGISEVAWDDLAVVDHYRAFLANSEVYLHHLLPPDALF